MWWDMDSPHPLRGGELLLGEWLLRVPVRLDSDAQHSLRGGEWLLGEWPLSIIMWLYTDSELFVKELLCVCLRLDTSACTCSKVMVSCHMLTDVCGWPILTSLVTWLTSLVRVIKSMRCGCRPVPCNHHPWAFCLVPLQFHLLLSSLHFT